MLELSNASDEENELKKKEIYFIFIFFPPNIRWNFHFKNWKWIVSNDVVRVGPEYFLNAKPTTE